MNKLLMRISADKSWMEPSNYPDGCIIDFNNDGYCESQDYIDAEIVNSEESMSSYMATVPDGPVRGMYCEAQSRIVSGMIVDLYV